MLPDSKPSTKIDGGAGAADGWLAIAEEGETTGRRGAEPLRTLAIHRAWDGAVWFGTNLVPETEGEIAVGDVVEALALRSRA